MEGFLMHIYALKHVVHVDEVSTGDGSGLTVRVMSDRNCKGPEEFSTRKHVLSRIVRVKGERGCVLGGPALPVC